MQIKNALVFTEDGCFKQQDIYTDQERISTVSIDGITIDGTDCYLIPGLIDIHFHGCIGHDFCDATLESLTAIAEYELCCGITSICPASMTLPKDDLIAICKNAASYSASWTPGTSARLCGIHLEGPFISKQKKGAQNPAFIIPCNVSMFEELYEASGNLVKLITLAPETDSAIDFIKQCNDMVRISVGHTDCDYETAKGAFLAGASHMTHLYNAMPPFTHRNPGPIGAGFESAHVTPEIICDGIHIDPCAVRAAFSLFGSERVIFISDSMMATGMPNGEYSLGGLAVHMEDSYATLEDGTLAGSATNLFDCMKNAVKNMRIPLEDAVRCATINPAKAIGEDKEYGSISVGKYADLLLIDKETLELKTVISHGIVVNSGL